MILEESVIFDDEESASEFVAFLRRRGCQARKTTRGIAFAEEVMTGTLDRLIDWSDRPPP
ncbi:MAG: hypothetical protein KO206_04145 [Methanomicrobiaceae archaeon]|uniref:Uncharacterized protein n=1 Tax=hydrocarbon metagenome TaxID=938273 RepID=A0A0W8FIL5_9ZZZZ|nr:hypothetical protein [Methanomicrobiaceae archaeon]MDD5418564.1 hypothetical protein [Methanomicrobiaceae archaeon]